MANIIICIQCKRWVLTVDTQRDGRFQALSLSHGTIPDHTPVPQAIVLALRRHRERADRLQIL